MVMPQRANAECKLAEQAEKSGKIGIAYMQYIYCAEEENDVEAQYKLGSMFYQGVGLSRPDFRRAVAFFSRAANNGYAPAQVKLGLLYWRGEGITKNLTMAHKWLYLAQEPENMRWFYYIGASSDPSAAGLYAKIDQALRKKSTSVLNVEGEVVDIPDLKRIIPSYHEVADFQHEKLLEAGDELLNEPSKSGLRRFLDGLKPDIIFPKNVSQIMRQKVINMYKPVLLTEGNLLPDGVPVLSNLKKEIEKPSE